jgi:ribosomal protein S18 acetylase RimI-like enzyme
MIIEGNLDEGRIPDIVRIHERAFPGFFLAEMGRHFLKEYYLTVHKYDRGIIISAVDGIEVCGFVAGVLDPVRFYSFLRGRAIAFVVPAMRALLRNPRLLIRLSRSVRRTGGARTTRCREPEEVAELTSIAVDPWCGRKGIGRELLLAFRRQAQEWGATRIVLTTDSLNNDRVNNFYIVNGFTLDSTFVVPGGRKMNEYSLSLSDSDH